MAYSEVGWNYKDPITVQKQQQMADNSVWTSEHRMVGCITNSTGSKRFAECGALRLILAEKARDAWTASKIVTEAIIYVLVGCMSVDDKRPTGIRKACQGKYVRSLPWEPWGCRLADTRVFCIQCIVPWNHFTLKDNIAFQIVKGDCIIMGINFKPLLIGNAQLSR